MRHYLHVSSVESFTLSRVIVLLSVEHDLFLLIYIIVRAPNFFYVQAGLTRNQKQAMMVAIASSGFTLLISGVEHIYLNKHSGDMKQVSEVYLVFCFALLQIK